MARRERRGVRAREADAARVRELPLFKDGTIRIDGAQYVGRASDGEEVLLGNVGSEEVLLRYLDTRPGPADW